MKTPPRRVEEFEPQLYRLAQTLLQDAELSLAKTCRLDIYCCDVKTGYFQYTGGGQSRIVMPLWAITKAKTRNAKTGLRAVGFDVWYMAHELAHYFNQVDGTDDIHGPCFMAWLQRICPAEYIHYELAYKPRLASASGITGILTTADLADLATL